MEQRNFSVIKEGRAARPQPRRLVRGQASVEFGISSILLLLILLGLVDFSRVFYFDTGLHGAARE
ncbi:MAG: pilus assembly protein, partial [Chloroflexi bacterium]